MSYALRMGKIFRSTNGHTWHGLLWCTNALISTTDTHTHTHRAVSYMTNNYFIQLNVSKFGLLALPPTPSLASRTKGGDV